MLKTLIVIAACCGTPSADDYTPRPVQHGPADPLPPRDQLKACYRYCEQKWQGNNWQMALCKRDCRNG